MPNLNLPAKGARCVNSIYSMKYQTTRLWSLRHNRQSRGIPIQCFISCFSSLMSNLYDKFIYIILFDQKLNKESTNYFRSYNPSRLTFSKETLTWPCKKVWLWIGPKNQTWGQEHSIGNPKSWSFRGTLVIFLRYH